MERLAVRAKEAANMLGIAPSTLAKMRMRNDGPPFVKANERLVLYRVTDLQAWMKSRLHPAFSK